MFFLSDGSELGPPWAVEYFPVRSCHIVFWDESGVFYLPLRADIKTNIWCNWTILADSQKHIVIYIQGFQGSDGCGKNQDKIIFQGVLSSVETKVVYACHNQGTLIFATQATAVHVLFLSGSGSLSHEYGHFKGRYYVFRDSETADTTKGLLPMLRASPGPSGALAGGRIQPDLVSPDEEAQHPPDVTEDAQSGANLSSSGQLWDGTELERNLKDDGTEDRETQGDVLLELSPAGQDAGRKAELSALETVKGHVDLVSARATIAPCHSVDVLSSEMPSSNVGVSAKSSSLDQASDRLLEEAVAAVHSMQTPVVEEPLLNTSTKPSSLYPSPGVTAGDVASPEERNEELCGKEFFGLFVAELMPDTVQYPFPVTQHALKRFYF